MINYIIIDDGLEIVVYFKYDDSTFIIQYYNPANRLHSHECLVAHHKLGVF